MFCRLISDLNDFFIKFICIRYSYFLYLILRIKVITLRFSMIYKILPAVLFFLMSFNSIETRSDYSKAAVPTIKTNFEEKIDLVYSQLKSNHFALPNLKSFSNAMRGFYLLKAKGLIQKDILTIVDFSLSANVKRLWVIDLSTNTILFNSLVAHGRNTGAEFATSFSNNTSSFKSCLGFFATGEIYKGKHGISLKLDGLEKGINDHARERAVVIHGADYVSESFVRNNKRLGRSLGCPAIPVQLSVEIINTIRDKSCLYIYHPSRDHVAYSS